jgi:predicted enzyme related to lactoylglutathione lyase
MFDPRFTLLYVADVPASVRFYEALFGQPPVEASSGFAMFALAGGGRLGLWKRENVEPPVTAPPGGTELVFDLPDESALRDAHRTLAGRGTPMLQAPTALDFGLSFVAADPSGHRLRFYVPAE